MAPDAGTAQQQDGLDSEKFVLAQIDAMEGKGHPQCPTHDLQVHVNRFLCRRVIHMPDETAERVIFRLKAESKSNGNSSISFGPQGFTAQGKTVVVILAVLVVLLAADRYAPKSWRFWESSAEGVEHALPALSVAGGGA